MLLNKFEFNPPAIIHYTSGRSELEIQIKFETSPISPSPMGLVKEVLKKEISNLKEFNARLDHQYPLLLQYAR